MTSAYDVEFITPTRKEGFLILSDPKNQDRIYKGGYGPSELAPEIVKSRDIPVIWDDVSEGMGFSQRWANIKGFSYGKNVYTRSPRLIMPGPRLFPIVINSSTIYGTGGGPVVASVHWDGKLLFFAGDKIIGISPSTPLVATNLAGLPAGITGSSFGDAQIFKGTGVQVLYVTDLLGQLIRKTAGSVAGVGFWDRAAAGTPSRFTKLAQAYQAQGDKSGWQLYGIDGLTTTQVWHVTGDPFTAANWSGPIKVGSGYEIREIFGSNRHIYYYSDDGLYDLDENGYSPNITEYLRDFPSSQNGQWAKVYNGAAYCSTAMGLARIPIGSGAREDIDSFCQPGVGLPNETPVYGPVTAGINEAGWLVIAQWNGTDTYISYGKERRVLQIQGPGPMVWYPEIFIPGEKVTDMCLDSQSGQNLMYIFTQPGGTGNNIKAYCYTIPDGTPLQDFLNGGKHRFSLTFELYLSSEDWEDSASKKNLMRFDVSSNGLGHLVQGDVTVAIDSKTEDGEFVRQGETNVSPRATIYPVGQYLSGYIIQTRISGVSIATGSGLANTTFPPIIRSIKARAGMVIEQRETKFLRLKMSSGTLKNGGIDSRDFEELEKWVYSLQNYGPINIVINDKELVAKVETGATYIETNYPRPGTAAREVVTEITISIIDEQESPAPQTITQYTGPVWVEESGPAPGTEPAWGDGSPDANDITWQS